MTTERFCLKWNDFQNNFQTSFEELRGDNDFTDVTLACEDKSIKAHKVILSACSPFFKKLLKTHPNPQPLIYMRGIKSNDLLAVVDFIYRGEANIFQDQLENFLALAEELELKGLSENCEEEESNGEAAKEYVFQSQSMKTAFDTQRSKNEGQALKYEGFNENAIVPMKQPKSKHSTLVDPHTMATIETMIDKHIDGGYACTNCDFKAKNKGHVKEHAEKHIEGLEYPCNSCNKVFRSSQSLRDHKRKSCQIIS